MKKKEGLIAVLTICVLLYSALILTGCSKKGQVSGNAGAGLAGQSSAQQSGNGYSIGGKGPAGGIIFYDQGSDINGWRYLEAAPPESEFITEEGWGLYYTDVRGTLSDLGAGKRNTEIILNLLKQNGESGVAADRAAALEINGYKDWFLPSKDELNMMYENLWKRKLGSFREDGTYNGSYYSSTQFNDNSTYLTWEQSFKDGQVSAGKRGYQTFIRAARIFKSDGQPAAEITFTRQLIELNPELGRTLDYEARDEAVYNEIVKVWVENEYYINDTVKEKLTAEQKRVFEKYGVNEAAGFWDVWRGARDTGPGPNRVTASSFLPPDSANVDYKPDNLLGGYRSAWVEGAKGYGIGEYVVFHFPSDSYRVTQVYIANGYISSSSMYQNNSRVKKLKMYVEDVPFAILNLEDIRREQIFTFEPIERAHYNPWTIKFEIMDVYKGAQHDDTAITSIGFDYYVY